MPRYFIPSSLGNRRRHIVQAYCRTKGQEYDEAGTFSRGLYTLISESGLLPDLYREDNIQHGSPDQSTTPVSHTPDEFELHILDDIESQSISPRDLNVYKLLTLGCVRIRWTENVSRHLLLSTHGGIKYVEIFALPCAISGGAEAVLEKVGVPADLMQDIKNSYAGLFNPEKPSRLHQILRYALALEYWCWCLSCSSHRLRTRELRSLQLGTDSAAHLHKLANIPHFDTSLALLAEQKPIIWDPTEFPTLWPRLLALNTHLHQSRPWSFWVLFRDSRDTLQYWTFLFGTLILVLTIVQVLLSIVQVAGSFVGS